MAAASVKPQSAAAEAPLEPDLPICDPHHHLRERPNDRYFLDEFIQDSGSGHNIVATVCVENRAMYRMDGPETMKPVGPSSSIRSPLKLPRIQTTGLGSQQELSGMRTSVWARQ